MSAAAAAARVVGQVGLGAALIGAGTLHLTSGRKAFRAQVSLVAARRPGHGGPGLRRGRARAGWGAAGRLATASEGGHRPGHGRLLRGDLPGQHRPAGRAA